jgi:hypothetical protein
VYAEGLNASLLATLERPDLRIVAQGLRVRFDLASNQVFHVERDGEIVLGPACLGGGRTCAFHLRHAIEIAWLSAAPEFEPCLAGLAAARVAALFWRLDAPGEVAPAPWIDAMADAAPPAHERLTAIWRCLAPLQTGASGEPDEITGAALARAWPSLGPVEQLLAAGGDARLAIDAGSRLNHYGCSHRPRPWAITYASSTASSLSERGFAGAEASRRRMACAALAGAGEQAALAEARRVQDAIAGHYGLPPDAGVVLAASGTDCELLALALASMADDRPVCNIVTAPDETGSGVPLASIGRHFAADTARATIVAKGALIAGMRDDIVRADLAVRHPDGTLIPPAEVDAACERLVGEAVAAGRRVLLHYLDLSKTGLLAPSIECVARLGRRHRGSIDVVVDGCQARLTAARVRSYVEVGWIVMVTGSKFFTGPPFCGALLLPAPMMRRLDARPLPAGLADYTGRADWPARAAGASAMPQTANLGMVLRWQAAIAEMQAFARVPASRKREILDLFTHALTEAIDAHPDLVRVQAPPLRRPALGDAQPGWDEIQTIIPFVILGADKRPLDLAEARRVYRWLNADVSGALPNYLPASDRFLAGLRCHIGQPAPVADGSGGLAGALRLSAGARLVSGEPSHEGIDDRARLAREIADAKACLDKLALLLRHHAALAAIDPPPSFGAPADP